MKIWKTLKRLGIPYIMLLACCYTLTSSTNIYILICLCVIMVPYHFIQTQLWDKNSGILLLWGISYFIITTIYYTPNSWANEIGYLLGPVTFYLCGKLFTHRLQNQGAVILMIATVCACSSITIFTMTFNDIAKGELIAYSRRFDVQDAVLAATLYGLVAAITLSGLGFFIAARKNTSKYLNIVFLVLFAGSILTTIHLINRTGIIIALVCTISIMAVQGARRAGRMIVLLAIVSIITIAYFGTDWLAQSVEAYSYRNESGLGLESGGGRFERWVDAIEKLFNYPFGWWLNHSTYNAQVHNLWLDIARVAGLIPFTLIVIFTVRVISKQYKILKKYKDQPIAILTFGIILSMLLASAVEPVIEAKICYMCLLIFFAGIESQMYEDRHALLKDK